MLLQPNDQWRWFVGEDKHLMLDLGEEMLFSSPYLEKHLSIFDRSNKYFRITMMVVETSPSASVCISLSAGRLLSGSKQLNTFAAIKVMNDRLVSLDVYIDDVRQVG